MQAELAHAMEQLKGQGIDLAEWREALAAKDQEIQNLQVLVTILRPIRLQRNCLRGTALSCGIIHDSLAYL